MVKKKKSTGRASPSALDIDLTRFFCILLISHVSPYCASRGCLFQYGLLPTEFSASVQFLSISYYCLLYMTTSATDDAASAGFNPLLTYISTWPRPTSPT